MEAWPAGTTEEPRGRLLDGGSRQNSGELLRQRLKNVRKAEGPRLFVFDYCRQFIHTVPVLPRDEIDSGCPSG